MEQFVTEVSGVTKLAGSFVKLEFAVPWKEAPVSGQFVSLGCGSDRILKRPFSIADWCTGTASVIFKTVGKGTEFLSSLKTGHSLTVLGPLGNGFPEKRGSEVIYAGGGCGLPPLLYDIARNRKKGSTPRIFAGFRTASEAALKEEFEACGAEVIIATDDGSSGEKGLVTDILKKYLESLQSECIIFSSGPMAMQKAVADLCKSFNVQGYLCLERYMACGFGVCQSCVQPVNAGKGGIEYVRVCTEGPVFTSSQIVWEE